MVPMDSVGTLISVKGPANGPRAAPCEPSRVL